MLTSKQRAILRGKANTMDPVYIVGKGEIDETMIQGVKDCLYVSFLGQTGYVSFLHVQGYSEESRLCTGAL